MGLFNFRKNKKSKIKAVFEADLIQYLVSLGIHDDILSGSLRCKYCGTGITLDNLQALIPDEDKIILVCSSAKCISNSKDE